MIEAIDKRLRGACRWYDCLCTQSESTVVSFRDNRLHAVRESQNSGCGLRVNIDNRVGFSFTNDASTPDGLVDRARATAPYGDIDDYDLPGRATLPATEPYRPSIDSFSVEREIDAARALIAELRGRFPDLSVDLTASRATGTRRLANSTGFDASYRHSSYGISIHANYVFDSGARLLVWEGTSELGPVDYRHLLDRLITKLDNAMTVRTAPSGKLPVLASPRAFASLLGILKPGLSAKAVYKGVSPFQNKLGERVFHEAFSLRDNPLAEDSPAGYPFDDEGTTAADKIIIDRGVIAGFVSDLKHAARLGHAPTGNASRGYASLPVPSFSAVIVPGGVTASAGLIEGMDRGVLVEQFIGLGQSNTLTGDFSANLDLAYLVEGGRIVGRVKDCMISDNLFSLLAAPFELSRDIERVGSATLPFVFFPAVNYTAN